MLSRENQRRKRRERMSWREKQPVRAARNDVDEWVDAAGKYKGMKCMTKSILLRADDV